MRCHECGVPINPDEEYTFSKGDHGFAVHPYCQKLEGTLGESPESFDSSNL